MSGTPPSPNGPKAVEVRDTRDDVEALQDRVMALLEKHGYPKSSRFAVRLAIEEALTNAFQHGHRATGKAEPVHVEFSVDPAEVRVAVEDRGPGFSPDDVPDPTLESNITSPTGRGLMLMRAYMDEVWHNERGNRVDMIYRRPGV